MLIEPRCTVLRQLNGHGFGAKGSSVCMNEEGEGSSDYGCNIVECWWWLEKLQRHPNEHAVGDGELNVSLFSFSISISLS